MKVLFFPEYPDKEFYTIVAIFMRLGYFATLDPNDSFDFAMAWQDRTWLDDSPVLQEIAVRKPVLNLHCQDISKHRVERVFNAVFGYSTFVDPIQHRGACVKKHDENAQGGSIIECPVSARDERFVYQKVIESHRDGHMIEYRVPIVLDSMPILYTMEKDIPRDSIKTTKQSARVTDVQAVFDADEQTGILEFCRRMGLDFGELDILRANDDGRIYILDANKTPGGFGMRNKMNWRPADRQFAIERLSAVFEAAIQERLIG
ncbi:MAG: hypothetical protein WAN46_13305 [Gammaproteobacteria bacterium]|jgi:hypothetical protein